MSLVLTINKTKHYTTPLHMTLYGFCFCGACDVSTWGTSNSKSSIDKSHRLYRTNMRQGKWNITEKFDGTPATRDAIIANRKQMKWCASWAELYVRLNLLFLTKKMVAGQLYLLKRRK